MSRYRKEIGIAFNAILRLVTKINRKRNYATLISARLTLANDQGSNILFSFQTRKWRRKARILVSAHMKTSMTRR